MPTALASNLVKRETVGRHCHGGGRRDSTGRNEAIYREVNERIAEVAATFAQGQVPTPVGFTCECDVAGCTKQIEMNLPEYEAIRAEPTRFLVVPGHERPEIEGVVERHSAYLVVEKRDEDAAEVARETDPR